MPDRTTILSNYSSDRWPSDFLDSVTIWEAARATSAASTFFEPIAIGPDKEIFIDGATGANNPVNVLWNEAVDIWKPQTYLEDDLQCLISIGTGIPSVNAFGSSLSAIGQSLKDMATQTETTAENFLRAHTKLDTEHRYFRFNVASGLEAVGLEDATEMARIVNATRRYLSSEGPKKHLEYCAENLQERECVSEFA